MKLSSISSYISRSYCCHVFLSVVSAVFIYCRQIIQSTEVELEKYAVTSHCLLCLFFKQCFLSLNLLPAVLLVFQRIIIIAILLIYPQIAE